MAKIAYLANSFPAAVEPYGMAEIDELRHRGAEVVPCSAEKTGSFADERLNGFRTETQYLSPFQSVFSAAWLCLRKSSVLLMFLRRILLCGKESPSRRLRALVHTWLGACFATRLEKAGIDHIHVHHGYYGSWIAMVAARLLEINFSLTLHGSDLLLHPSYLDIKLEQCQFCVTISEFNRRHILQRYPQLPPDKVHVRRLGVDSNIPAFRLQVRRDPRHLTILSVGRLHPVKNHEFLIQACDALKRRGLSFNCWIAGEGSERHNLESLITALNLEGEIELLGHVTHEHLGDFYEAADLVVLTSRSEGIPLVLMEAMAREKIVLAPAITGIPELVVDGKTGLLYQPESLDDFVAQVEMVQRARSVLGSLRRSAKEHVLRHFNQRQNLASFCELLMANVASRTQDPCSEELIQGNFYENPVLQ